MAFDNYIYLRKFSPGRLNFCYIDTPAHLADSIFRSHRVPVKFLREYRKDGTEYELIFCRIKKKYGEEFLKSLDELKTKMLICGHPDYEEFCGKIINSLDEERKMLHNDDKNFSESQRVII